MDMKSKKIVFVIVGLVFGASFFVASLVFGAEIENARRERKARADRIAAVQEMHEKSFTVDLARHELFDEKDAELESESETTTEAVTKPVTEEQYTEPEYYEEDE